MAEQWLKSQSKKIQIRGKEPQNFFKHGHRYPRRTLRYVPKYAAMLIYDAALCYEHIAGKMTPLMDVFMTRFLIEYPSNFRGDLGAFLRSKGLEIDKIGPLRKPHFLKRFLPVVMAGGRRA